MVHPAETRISEGVFTVSHLIDSFSADLTIRVKLGTTEEGTRSYYEYQLKKLRAAVGGFPAAELRAHHLTAVELTHHFVRVVRRLYHWAVDEDVQLVPRDPFKKLLPPPCGERKRVLTRAEFRRLKAQCSPEFRRLMFVQLRTLARPGEIRQLTWGQVNWPQSCLVLTKFKAQKRRKDKARARLIPLPKVVIRVLRAMFRAAGGPTPDTPVFLNTRGRPWSANATRCAMRRARAAAGLIDGGETVVLYTLRHTGATDATRNGVRDKTLADIMGHTRTQTTNRYQHLDASDLVAAVEIATRRRSAS